MGSLDNQQQQQPSPVNADTERREFEAWFITIASGRYADWLKRWDNGAGDYYYTEARTAWAAWSARALIRAQQMPATPPYIGPDERTMSWQKGLALHSDAPAQQMTDPVTYQLRFRRESGEWSEWQNVVSPWDGSRNPAWEYRPLYAAFTSPEHRSAPAVNGSLPSGESDPAVTLDFAGAGTAIQPQRMPDRETLARTAYAADPDLQVWRSTGEPNFTWEEIKNFPNAEDHCLPFYNIADAIIAITRPDLSPTEEIEGGQS